jgi:hypothetical protein
MIYYKFMCLHLQSWCTSSINDLSFGLMTKFEAWGWMCTKKVTVDPHSDWTELLHHGMHGGFSLPLSLLPSWVLTYLLTYLLPWLHNNNPIHLELMNTWDPSWSIADSNLIAAADTHSKDHSRVIMESSSLFKKSLYGSMLSTSSLCVCVCVYSCHNTKSHIVENILE